jgi:hypothetical protein
MMKRFSAPGSGCSFCETSVRLSLQGLAALAWFVTAPALHGAIITEDFATNPLDHQWRAFGDSNLFILNQESQSLTVTWDSSRGNSYYYLPLGNILNREDDFSMALDLELVDFHAGVNPNKASTFELALGFMNIVDGTKTNFLRGNSSLAPNLVEFDFFPDTEFGPTIWPSVWSTNSSPNYNGSSDYAILSLPTGIVMRVVMSYAASNQTLSTSVTTNGIAIGVINSVALSSSFTDFRVNAFALESYSDAGQDPRYGGSLLAHGRVDNIVVKVPSSPVQNLEVMFANQQPQVSFTSRTNWVYEVERSTDLQTWTSASQRLSGNGQSIFWQDTNAPAMKAFYRVRSERP